MAAGCIRAWAPQTWQLGVAPPDGGAGLYRRKRGDGATQARVSAAAPLRSLT